ncbi:MAG: phosphoserine phosphatase SerB [Emcibacter sp.]|nr:phosphoserine phosphatase SerB [Emcibacter sp.]
MKNILTLISNPANPVLTDQIIARYVAKLEKVTNTTWLSKNIAADIYFDGDLDKAKKDLNADLLLENFDYGFQNTASRVKKLFVADMDSTIIQCECIDELADFAGLKAKVSAITEAAMRGELDFEQALRERVSLLTGMDADVLHQVYNERVRLMPGALSLIKTMNANNARTVLVSGGFTFFTEKVANLVGFKINRGNILEIKNNRLTGNVLDPIVDSSTKINSLVEFREKAKLSKIDTMAIGDGANDIPMIREAGLGIAYHPKPAAAEAADIVIRHADLTAVLYLQGYSDQDFVTA